LSPRTDPNYAKNLKVKLKPEHTSILELEGKLGHRDSVEDIEAMQNGELSLSPADMRR